MARTERGSPLQASGNAQWASIPADLLLHPRSAICVSASPFSTRCCSPRSPEPNLETSRSLEQFLVAARECVVVLPACELRADGLPEPDRPPAAQSQPASERQQLQSAQDGHLSLLQPQQLQSQPGAAVSISDPRQPESKARHWHQAVSPESLSAVLQCMSPLGAEAAFVPPRSSFESKWGAWVDCMVDSCMSDMRQSDSASDLHSEFGGAAEVLDAGPAPERGSAEADAGPPAAKLRGSADVPLRSDCAAACGGRLVGKSTHTSSRFAGLGERGGLTPGWRQSAASGVPCWAGAVHPAAEEQLQRTFLRSRRQRRSGFNSAAGAAAAPFWQCFRDPALERRFRLSQAALLRPVDMFGSATVTFAAIVTGFFPAPLWATAPLTWPLVVVSPGARALLASRLPHQTYFGWRELIAVLSSLLTLAHGVAVLCPGFVPYLPAARLTNPVLFVRLIGGEMQLFLGAFNRVRFCVWLPVQLLGNLIAVAALPRMGALFEAAGAAAPAGSVVFWGALYHLTLGFLLPGAFLWMLERWERRQFLAELQREQADAPKLAVAHVKAA